MDDITGPHTIFTRTKYLPVPSHHRVGRANLAPHAMAWDNVAQYCDSLIGIGLDLEINENSRDVILAMPDGRSVSEIALKADGLSPLNPASEAELFDPLSETGVSTVTEGLCYWGGHKSAGLLGKPLRGQSPGEILDSQTDRKRAEVHTQLPSAQR